MVRFAALLVLPCLLVPTCFAQSEYQYAKKIDELVAPWVEAGKFTSLSVGVVHDNDEVWTRHYGAVTPGGSKATDRTLYEIGSMSKVFTSVLLADAVVQGKVKLDDSIDQLMPALKKSNADVGSSITLMHLSHHTSGLGRMPTNIRPKDGQNPFDGYDRDLLDAFMESVRPARKPGATHEYSNLGAGLLGDLLARQAGIDYDALIRARIAGPLKMADTMVIVPQDQMSRFAPPFNGALLPDKRWDFQALAGAGAIRSTVLDMTRFLQANMTPPKGKTGEAIDLAYKQHRAPAKGQPAMGLGWMIAGDGSTRWHNGMTGGYESMMLVNRELKTGVVVLCNTAVRGVDGLGEQIFQACVGADVKPRSFPKVAKVDPATVERLAGIYQMAPGVLLTIKTNDGRMTAQITGQQFLALKPVSKTEWKYDLVEATLHFELPESGPSPRVTLHQAGRKIPATRQAD